MIKGLLLFWFVIYIIIRLVLVSFGIFWFIVIMLKVYLFLFFLFKFFFVEMFFDGRILNGIWLLGRFLKFGWKLKRIFWLLFLLRFEVLRDLIFNCGFIFFITKNWNMGIVNVGLLLFLSFIVNWIVVVLVSVGFFLLIVKIRRE